jgi:RHH-type transcriptional regulator, rel operon repressor / antitoxin RelB
MTKTMISARVDDKLNDELEAMALANKRSKAFFINEAIEEYIAKQTWMMNKAEAALREADESGEYISNEAMEKWMMSWGTENELPPPEPDVFRPKRPI